jgi:hypothetical protein
MAFARRHFDAGDDVKRIVSPMRVSPQTRVQHIVIGDGNHVQTAPCFDVFQHLLHSCQTITRFGMHVDVSAACELIHLQDVYSLVKCGTVYP